MVFSQLCPPALIYLVFSITQVVIDTIRGMYNTALMKIWVAIVFTILLNYLCTLGLGIVSWFIVFVPFIMMTVVTTILLYVFGLDPQSGKINSPQHRHGRHKRKITPHRHHHMHTKCKKKKTGCRNPNCTNCSNCSNSNKKNY